MQEKIPIFPPSLHKQYLNININPTKWQYYIELNSGMAQLDFRESDFCYLKFSKFVMPHPQNS